MEKILDYSKITLRFFLCFAMEQFDNKFDNKDISFIVKPSVDRGLVFDRFLTYRRRMARLVSVQVAYLYDINQKIDYHRENTISKPLDSEEKKSQKTIITLCQEIVYFYKTSIFGRQEYGSNRKNKKIDEGFVFEMMTALFKNLDKIDTTIAKHIKANWSISKLDTIIRAILRCATSEAMFGHGKDLAILTSEYTIIAANFYSGKEIGFINATLDAIFRDLGLKNRDK